MSLEAQAVYYIAENKVTLQSVSVAQPVDDQVLIETYYSAISPGTEDMIFKGLFPQNTIQDTTIKSLSGDFSYPFKYGYALVGEIIAIGKKVEKKWLHSKVFAFHPHQSYALLSLQDCMLIPEQLSMLQALFLPNMEAAINFIMDAAPMMGEKVLVMGQGIVGLLTSALLSRFPLSLLLTCDPLVLRRKCSLQVGAMQTINPNEKLEWQALHQKLFNRDQDGFDLVFELSGNMDALNKALEMTGFSGRILIGSWYSNNEHYLDLGGSFHRSRIRLLSSQVSTINPELSGRWDKARRMQLVWDNLRYINPQRFITHRYPLQQCQQAFEINSEYKHQVIQVILEYNNNRKKQQ